MITPENTNVTRSIIEPLKLTQNVQTVTSEESFTSILNNSPNETEVQPELASAQNSRLSNATEKHSKPNLRELMESVTGRTMDELYADPNSNWKKISKDASEILYGVVGSNNDTRDWESIMSSENIFDTARSETEKMYGLKVDIVSEVDSEFETIAQYPVLKDNKDNILRRLSGHVNEIKETLVNFGAKKESFAPDLQDKITFKDFQPEVKNLFLNLSKDSPTTQETVTSEESFTSILNNSPNETEVQPELASAQNSRLSNATEKHSKPNLRELMESVTGRTMDELYADPNSNWKKISKDASEILYGVVGSNNDTRDWESIMSSENIFDTARSETEKMYGLKVDIVSEVDSEFETIAQYPVLKDNKDNILRRLSGHVNEIKETLVNFGAKKESFAPDLQDKITFKDFQPEVKNLFLNLSKDSPTTQETLVHTTIDLITTRIENLSKSNQEKI